MNIGSGLGWPSRQLSNFAPSPFVIDGVRCNSMEGFIQSLKFKNPEMQKFVCLLVGRCAKFKGKDKKWWMRPPKEQLWWMGSGFPGHSDEHLWLVKRALRCKFLQHNGSMRALIATRDAVLTHSVGKEDRTSLRASDFCRMLTEIRDELKRRSK